MPFCEHVVCRSTLSKNFLLTMSQTLCLSTYLQVECYCRDKFKSPKKEPNEVLDELHSVGHDERPNLAVIFTTIGQCFAHSQCAAWSRAVERAPDGLLTSVDKAVVRASESKCFFCNKLGASVPCMVSFPAYAPCRILIMS